jgi:trans-aconitate 2-methyltransferase
LLRLAEIAAIVAWDPDLYLRFRCERFVPFEDLARLIRVRPGLQVVDLGCGTGELTRKLAEMLPDSEVVGVDRSPEMLGRAVEHADSRLRFEEGSIESVRGQWDLVFSHAALHWVANHESLVPRLFSLVRPGGQLAVQLPSNQGHFSQTVIPEVASEDRFRGPLDGWVRRSPVLPLEQYAELLYAAGARDPTVFEKVYGHVLADADAVAEWLSGTTLVPYLTRLPETLRDEFLERYLLRLRERWPSGPVFFTFRRILFAADRTD